MSIISNSNIGNLSKIRTYFDNLIYVNYRVIENKEKHRYDIIVSQKYNYARIIINAEHIPSGCKIKFENKPEVILYNFKKSEDYNKISKEFILFNKTVSFRNCIITKDIIKKYMYLDASNIKDCIVHIDKEMKMTPEFMTFYTTLVENNNITVKE